MTSQVIRVSHFVLRKPTFIHKKSQEPTSLTFNYAIEYTYKLF